MHVYAQSSVLSACTASSKCPVVTGYGRVRLAGNSNRSLAATIDCMVAHRYMRGRCILEK